MPRCRGTSVKPREANVPLTDAAGLDRAILSGRRVTVQYKGYRLRTETKGTIAAALGACVFLKVSKMGLAFVAHQEFQSPASPSSSHSCSVHHSASNPSQVSP